MARKTYAAPTVSRVQGALQQAFGQSCVNGPDNTGGLCSRGFQAQSGGVCGHGADAEEGTCSRGFFAVGGECANGPFAGGNECNAGLAG